MEYLNVNTNYDHDCTLKVLVVNKYHFQHSALIIYKVHCVTDHFSIHFQLLANIVKKEYAPIQDIVELLLEWSEEELFSTYSVSDLLWGYDDPLLNKTLTILESVFHKKFSITDKFGIFVGVSHIKKGIWKRLLSTNIKCYRYTLYKQACVIKELFITAAECVTNHFIQILTF